MTCLIASQSREGGLSSVQRAQIDGACQSNTQHPSFQHFGSEAHPIAIVEESPKRHHGTSILPNTRRLPRGAVTQPTSKVGRNRARPPSVSNTSRLPRRKVPQAFRVIPNVRTSWLRRRGGQFPSLVVARRLIYLTYLICSICAILEDSIFKRHRPESSNTSCNEHLTSLQ